MASTSDPTRSVALSVLALAAVGALASGIGTWAVRGEVNALRKEVALARAERAAMRESLDSLTVAVSGLHQTVRALTDGAAAPPPARCTTADDCRMDESCFRGRCRPLQQ